MKARFAIELPPGTWIREVSASFPDTEFRLLTGIAVEDGAVELGEVVGGDVDAVVDAIRAHRDVREPELLYRDEERALAQYRTDERSLYEFLRASSLPPEFPIVVADGWFEFEVTAAREQVASFRSLLEDGDWPHEVRSVVQNPDPEGLLTDRQREVLDAALRRGYFAVPRECTLADLAANLDVDKSTASGVLRRAQQRLVTWFLTGAGGDSTDATVPR